MIDTPTLEQLSIIARAMTEGTRSDLVNGPGPVRNETGNAVYFHESTEHGNNSPSSGPLPSLKPCYRRATRPRFCLKLILRLGFYLWTVCGASQSYWSCYVTRFFQLNQASKFLACLRIIGRLTWSGVDLFFVLSGFLIGGILLDAKSSPRYFKTFYLRRAYRILPLYAVVLTAFSFRYITGLGSGGLLEGFSHSPIPWAAYATFTQNIWMAVLGTFGLTPISATWSLAVEEQFYITVPFVIRKIDRSHLTFALISVIVAAPLLRTALRIFLEHGNYACAVLMPCRADALSLGILCALLARTDRSWKFLLAHRSALCGLTGFFFLGLVVLTIWGGEATTVMVTIGYSWLAFFYTGCLLIAITGANATIQRILCTRSLMRLGVLAYCTYLLHLPLIELSRRVLGLRFSYVSTGTQLISSLVGVLLTLGVATLSWRFFEKPLLRRGQTYKY